MLCCCCCFQMLLWSNNTDITNTFNTHHTVILAACVCVPVPLYEIDDEKHTSHQVCVCNLPQTYKRL